MSKEDKNGKYPVVEPADEAESVRAIQNKFKNMTDFLLFRF